MYFFFFFNDTATTEIYTLSLHDALPIWLGHGGDSLDVVGRQQACSSTCTSRASSVCGTRSEEHTSELQSPCNLVCRLLLEKKKKKRSHNHTSTIQYQSYISTRCLMVKYS